MSKKPLIAVVGYRLPAGRVTGWSSGAYAAPDLYIDAVRRAGGRPVILPYPDDTSPQDALSAFDGLMLLGGADVDPARYGAERHPETYGLDPARDALEFDLVCAADRAALPTLAICRGAQVVNVAFGGTLHQHLPDGAFGAHGTPGGGAPIMHDVEVEPDSLLADAAGATRLAVSSHHHQGLARIGGGLRVTGRAPDGLVEAVEAEHGWLIAVQWHPEDTASTDPTQQGLFDAFVLQAASARQTA